MSMHKLLIYSYTDARVALERGNCLLQMKHGIVRLDSIWGFGGGIRPVKLLVKEIVLMIKVSPIDQLCDTHIFSEQPNFLSAEPQIFKYHTNLASNSQTEKS